MTGQPLTTWPIRWSSFARANGPEVDLGDYEPLLESLEPLPDGDDADEVDAGKAA
jgi:hypothetical protein